MDIFRINDKLEYLTSNLEESYPILTGFTKPLSRFFLVILPIIATILYTKIMVLGLSFTVPFHLVDTGSEAEYSLRYITVIVPVLYSVAISFILPSCWAIRSVDLEDRLTVIDLVGSLILLMLLGYLLPKINEEILKALPVISPNRAAYLSSFCYGSIILTLVICHWPTPIRFKKSSKTVAAK